MTRKLESSYEHLFTYINTNVCELKPASFMTDFERGMRNAIKTVWPEVNQYTCWFHYCQAIKRHSAQIPEFMSIVRGETSKLKIYYDVMCLPLLPPADINIAFMELKAEALAKYGELYTKFLHYVESYWLKKVDNYLNCILCAFNETENYIIPPALIGRARKNFGARSKRTHNFST